MNAMKTSGTKGNCSIFHSDIQSSKAHSLKTTIKSFSHVSKGPIRNINLKLIKKKEKKKAGR